VGMMIQFMGPMTHYLTNLGKNLKIMFAVFGRQQTNSKHVIWSLKENIGDRYKFRISVFMLSFMFQGLLVIILSTVQRTQNLAANKYTGEGMGQENSSVLKKVQIYDRSEANELFCKFFFVFQHLNLWFYNEKRDILLNQALMFQWLPKNPVGNSKIPDMIALILLGLGFIFSFARIILVNRYAVIKTSSVRPALELDIDLEELEVHYSSFIMKTFFCLFSRQDW
ncbi:hypothetical protein ACJX0J_042300, partial [Zea mays]